MTMVVKNEVPAGDFKAQCLKLMDRVQQSREEIVITKRGAPVAKLVPIDEEPRDVLGCMEGTAEIVGDVLSPAAIPEDWEALR